MKLLPRLTAPRPVGTREAGWGNRVLKRLDESFSALLRQLNGKPQASNDTPKAPHLPLAQRAVAQPATRPQPPAFASERAQPRPAADGDGEPRAAMPISADTSSLIVAPLIVPVIPAAARMSGADAAPTAVKLDSPSANLAQTPARQQSRVSTRNSAESVTRTPGDDAQQQGAVRASRRDRGATSTAAPPLSAEWISGVPAKPDSHAVADALTPTEHAKPPTTPSGARTAATSLSRISEVQTGRDSHAVADALTPTGRAKPPATPSSGQA